MCTYVESNLEGWAAVKVLCDSLLQDDRVARVHLQGDSQGDGCRGAQDLGTQGFFIPSSHLRAHGHGKESARTEVEHQKELSRNEAFAQEISVFVRNWRRGRTNTRHSG